MSSFNICLSSIVGVKTNLVLNKEFFCEEGSSCGKPMSFSETLENIQNNNKSANLSDQRSLLRIEVSKKR